MGWSFLDFTGLSHFFSKLPEKVVTTDTTQTISGTKSFSSTILGSVSGSAASAAKDGSGNIIADTYETKADAATHLSKSDAAGTYLSKTDAASAYVQTGAVDQTVAGTKTFSKPIVGSVTGSSGSCTGNAATATQFSANATVALTGDATGTSAGSKKGWSVPVTLANSGVTAGTYGPSADVTGNNNATISVPEITVDAKGRVTSVTNRTLTCKNNTYNVYNKTLTIQKNGTNVATFTSNSNTDVTANITVPTKTSELTNDSGFLTSHQSLSNYVTLNGAQTISGAKTFSGLIKTAGKTEQSSPSDLNDALYNVESYSWGTSTTNKPSSSYGILLNLNREGNVHSSTSSGWRAQLGVGTDTRLYLRTKANTGGEWSAWKEFLTSHQSLSNYSTLANTVKSLSISGKTITVTPGSGSAYTLTTQDTVYTHPTTSGNKHIPSGGSSGQFLGWASDGTAKWVNNPNTNTDTLMTQNVSTTNATYPVLLVATADATANQGAKTGIFAKSVKVNPSTNVISASGFSGPLTGNVTGNCSGSSGSCTGNAATATKLATARTINGTAFNGTDNITTANWGTARNISITDGTNTSTAVSVNGSANVSLNLPATIKATFVGNITGNVTGNCSGSSGSCTGNAATATKLATARTIALSGAATGTATGFDGSGNITIPVTALASSAIRAQWYAAYPDGAEAHNAMWGGRDITAAFDAGTVSEHIADGSFKDIFPGDYITKQVTIPQVLADDGTTVLFAGGTYTVNWVVADCDYWINKGDTATTAHHVVIVPQAPIFSANMNATNTTEGGYKGSAMYQNIIPAVATGLIGAFGSSHILKFRDAITNRVDTGAVSSGVTQWTGASGWWGEWADAYCNLMSEKMVYGAPITASGAMDNAVALRQMSAFRLSEKAINYNRAWYWLRDVVSSAYFALVRGTGNADANSASNSRSVRPFALLC